MQSAMAGKPKSIFDILEEQSASPQAFAWTMDPGLCEGSLEDLLLEGELQRYNEAKGCFAKRRYVLTKTAFIQYKVLPLALTVA